MRKSLRIVLIVLLAAVFVFCGAKLVMALLEYRQAEDIYNAEREQVFHLDEGTETSPSEEPSASSPPETPEQQETEEYFPAATVDFEKLREENPDVVGWLWIPDTDISYPLVRGEDNEEYLHTTYNGVYNSSGSIFMDYRSSPELTDDNTVIYGHNMKNGAMFGKLDAFGQQEYFDAHEFVYIFTPDAVYKYRCFSAYVTDVYSQSYTFQFGEGEKAGYIEYAASASSAQSDIIPAESERLLMLSTCTSRVRTERFVLHAALVAVKEN